MEKGQIGGVVIGKKNSIMYSDNIVLLARRKAAKIERNDKKI